MHGANMFSMVDFHDAPYDELANFWPYHPIREHQNNGLSVQRETRTTLRNGSDEP